MISPVSVVSRLAGIERGAVTWMARHGSTCTRLSLGVVFLWFGAVKLVPGMSPAEGLVGDTLLALTWGWIPPRLSVPGLGIWESLIGLGLLTGCAPRWTLALLFFQMAGTFTPLIVSPEVAFVRFPWVLSLEGQYIAKNVVLISGAMVIGSHVRADAYWSQR